MKTILVTGAAGFVGMHTAIKFLKEGHKVIGLDNMNDYYDVQLKRDRVKEIEKLATPTTFKMFYNDLNDGIWEQIGEEGVTSVVHLAAQAGVRYSIENPNAYVHSNIMGFQRVLEFVTTHEIQEFLYASSSSVYGMNSEQPFKESEPCNKPESYYAATKKSNELMAHAYSKTHKLSSLGLRFFTVYGPWGRPDMAPFLFTKAAFDGQGIKVFNHGNQSRDFTYVGDIVDGIFLMWKNFHKVKGADVCNIGFGAPSSLMDFISSVEKHTGVELPKEYVEAQKGDVAVTYADTTKLAEYTGYKPSITLDEGIKEFVGWYKQYYSL